MHWSNSPIETQVRIIDGLSIRFAESDDRDDHALLLSPWPESLLAFEPTWTRLAARAHLVAIDLPGFGHSQRRDTLMSPRTMGEYIVLVADAFGLEAPARHRPRRRHRGLALRRGLRIRTGCVASSSGAGARRQARPYARRIARLSGVVVKRHDQ